MNIDPTAPKEVRPQLVGADNQSNAPHLFHDMRYALDRNTVVVPFRQRLRANADHSGELGLRSAALVAPLKPWISHPTLLQRRLILGKPSVDCFSDTKRYNQLMVYKKSIPKPPEPSRYATFQDWINAWVAAFPKPYGAQGLIAKAADLSTQLINNWKKRGEKPTNDKLEKLANAFDLSLPELVLLANGGNAKTRSQLPEFLTSEMLTHWNSLDSADEALEAIAFMQALAAKRVAKKKRRVG